jgi:hypothetical protein
MPAAIPLSPAEQERFRRSHRWIAVLQASLLAAAILWLFPSGNPWTAFAGPSATQVMGRPVSNNPAATILSLEALPAHLLHFAVAVAYGFAILPLAYRLRSWRAIFGGMAAGFALYAINFALFRALAPQFTGEQELNVVLAHVLFGGIAGGAMRGFLRPPQGVDENAPNPGPRYP